MAQEPTPSSGERETVEYDSSQSVGQEEASSPRRGGINTKVAAILTISAVGLLVLAVFLGLGAAAQAKQGDEAKAVYTKTAAADVIVVGEREELKKDRTSSKPNQIRTMYYCTLSYSFSVEAETIQAEREAPFAEREPCSVTYAGIAQADIFYNPTNPADFTDINPQDASAATVSFVLFGIAGLLGVLGLILGAVGVRALKRNTW